MTELSSNSGMYSASTTAAITTPITTRMTGSISVMNRADLRLDLLVVEIREAVQHLLQRSSGFADFDHLDCHVGKDAPREERRGEALSFAHPTSDFRGSRAPKCRFVIAPPAISRAFTSGMPPPISVASVRAS